MHIPESFWRYFYCSAFLKSILFVSGWLAIHAAAQEAGAGCTAPVPFSSSLFSDARTEERSQTSDCDVAVRRADIAIVTAALTRGQSQPENPVSPVLRSKESLTGITPGQIEHIGTTQIWSLTGQNMAIGRPVESHLGDLLILILHRTDDILPYALKGWKRAAECYKEENGYDCLSIKDCTDRKSGFCNLFKDRYEGLDLAQTVFYRSVGYAEPSDYLINLNRKPEYKGQPGWAIMIALRGANNDDPVRSWSSKGCDHHADSVFPSVYGHQGDMLLLSQSFDDAAERETFGAPSGMATLGYINGNDEAGFLYGGILSSTGPTGVRKTRGSGASECKDALVSLTIRPL